MILRHPPEGASSRVRGLEMAKALSARGTRVRVAHPGQGSWKIRGLWLGLFSKIAIFQKRWSANDRRLLNLRQTLGRPSVFDLDDAPGTVHESPEQERRVAQMMRLASAVTVGSHALHDFAIRHNDNVRLIPSAVDTDVFKPRAKAHAAPVTIGWIGNGPGYWQGTAGRRVGANPTAAARSDDHRRRHGSSRDSRRFRGRRRRCH